MADLIKSKFRQFDKDGSGLIKIDSLSDVLVRVGIPGRVAHDLLQALGNKSGEFISYEAFFDCLFTSVPMPNLLESQPASRFPKMLQVEHRPNLGRQLTKLPTRKVETEMDADTFGQQNLLRALKTLTKGRLRHAEDPAAALRTFCKEAEMHQDMHRQMLGHLAALQKGEALGLEQKEAEAWEKFARWCVEQLLLEVFEVADMSNTGKLSMQELMVMLMLIAVQRHKGETLMPQDVEQVMREFDITGDGQLNTEEFSRMVHSLEREAYLFTDADDVGSAKPPHLVLNFDVNNTVLIADTLTGADASKLLSMTLAGSCWGVRNKKRDTGEDSWVLIDHQPRTHPLWEGLMSYAQFVGEQYPLPKKGASFDEVEAMKQKRREALYYFCEPGRPGEAMRPHLDKLVSKLHVSSSTKLLPSFFFLLHSLKRAGRSFSIVFRTFGVDMDESIEQEFNAFCEGRCPYFATEGLVLDGSDGGQDHRMDLGDQSSIGTFYRNKEDNNISLVWGTHQQPPKNQGSSFFATLAGTRTHVGAPAAAASLWDRLYKNQRTVVLRDFYPGWATQNFNSEGGKPIFVNIEDESVFSLMFDDHVQPTNPSIVDVIDVREYPRRVPMAQVYDIHVVKATPIRSIAEISYFVDELARCEAAKVDQLKRRRKVARLLHDVEAIRTAIVLLGGAEGHDCKDISTNDVSWDVSLVREAASHVEYRGWNGLEVVRHCPPLTPDATDEPEVPLEPAVVELKRIASRSSSALAGRASGSLQLPTAELVRAVSD